MSPLHHGIARMEADGNRQRRIQQRADAIVSTHTPALTGPVHGFYDPAGFVERAVYNDNRKRLLRIAQRELRALGYAQEHWQADYDAALASLPVAA